MIQMYREKEFELFLINEPSIKSKKAVASRLAKARNAAELLGKPLDVIVSDDKLMYDSLLTLKENEDPAHAPMQNAVRKYYKFINRIEFPRIRNYTK